MYLCCLQEGHKVVGCGWESTCNIDGSLKNYSRMLHGANEEDDLEQNSGHQSKLSLIKGEENQIQSAKNRMSKTGVYFIAGSANNCRKWD